MIKEEVTFINEHNKEVTLNYNKSFNKGTKKGNSLLLESLRSLGCGKSIVVDKNNTILCGDKVVKALSSLKKNKVRVIETDGEELIIVKRTDLDADTARGMEMSLVDNLIHTKNIDWDTNHIIESSKIRLSFDPRRWDGYECMSKPLDIEDLFKEDIVENRKRKIEKDIVFFEDLCLFE